MSSSSVIMISLINNAALLLALGLLYDLLGFRPKGQSPTLQQLLTGVILGSVGIAIMLNPWELGQGVVFDTRSVLLSISGFFFGTLPTILAVMMTAAFRLLAGGTGAWTGVAVIVTSGGIGLAWRHLRRGKQNPSFGELYILGLAVHVAMLLWMLMLPQSIAIDVLAKISLPVMLIYPAATAVLGKMLLNRESRKRAEKKLLESEERFRNIFQHHSAVKLLIDPDTGNIIDANEAAARFYGWPVEELKTKQIQEINVFSAEQVEQEMEKARTLERIYFEFRHRLSDGSVRDVEVYSSRVEIRGKDLLHSIIHDITAKKEAEEALRRSRSFLDTLMNAIPIPVFHKDREGRYTGFNRAYETFYGASQEQLIGKSVFEISPPELATVYQAKDNELFASGGTQRYESQVRNAHGELRDVIFFKAAFPDTEGNTGGLIGAILDITKRKKTERALQEREQQYNAIVENTGDYIMRYDADHRHVFANRRAIEATGLTPEEYLGRTHREMGFPEHLCELWEHAIDEAFATGEERKVEFDVELDQGLMTLELQLNPDFDAEGRVHSVIGVSRDVTERKKAQREDRLNKARLEIIHNIATMPEATEKDICDFVLESMIELTESAIGFLGFLSEDEEIMQIHAWSSSAMAECAIHDKPIEFPIAKAGLWGEPIRNREPIIVNDYSAPHPAKNGCPEGHVRISRFMAVPVFEGDRIVAVSAVGNRERPYSETDVRQLMLLMDSWWEQVRRKRAVRERGVLQARLQQAQKMESIGTLAGGIAHDFNNILSIILGNTEMAMHDLPEWSPVQESLKEAREASLRARDLVTQMLLFARQKEQTISNLRVEPIAKESLKMLRASIPAMVEIREGIQEGLPPVLADPSQLQQIIMNLCTNAAQVMEKEGGILDFSMDSVEFKGSLDTVTGPIPEGRYVRMRVRDNGPGIAPGYVERIFDPFFTTKGIGEGTGLGLAVVHGIVQGRHGGITVESEPDKGTTFSVYLPVSKGGMVEKPSKEESELPNGTERILFVDDEPMIMKLGQRMLERQGYKVETRASGTVALECFRQDPNRFDLVVTDMSMPGMRGDRLAEEIMEIRPDIHVILSTGYSKQISKEKAQEMGIRAFVMKPLTQHELAETVRRVLDEKPRK